MLNRELLVMSQEDRTGYPCALREPLEIEAYPIAGADVRDTGLPHCLADRAWADAKAFFAHLSLLFSMFGRDARACNSVKSPTPTLARLAAWVKPSTEKIYA